MCKQKSSNEAPPKAAQFNQPINLMKIVPKDEAANKKGCVCEHYFSVNVIMQYMYSQCL
jgi:hypothetical protein